MKQDEVFYIFEYLPVELLPAFNHDLSGLFISRHRPLALCRCSFFIYSPLYPKKKKKKVEYPAIMEGPFQTFFKDKDKRKDIDDLFYNLS